MKFTPQEPTKKELREMRERVKHQQCRDSFHLKLFGRIQSKLCRINGGNVGGCTEFQRTKAVMAILVRAKLVEKLP